ncbi:MAG: tRNA pseudouridine(38-40) synthase TruA [Planctomycetaceae bacterium]|nr:tRNA pseudouridine(38-40) synthase TruA [Planctomycetaceae bacterium]
MRSILLTIAYEGGAYAGWQVQPGQRTIQGELEQALLRITGETIRVIGSGRTDAGVHALGQVAGFRTSSPMESDVFQRALNAELPDDIAVVSAAEAVADFHPIRDSESKRYRYQIDDGPVRDVFARRYAWHCRHGLDEAAMAAGAVHLLGRHDFSSFETAGAERPDSIRTVSDISVIRGGNGASSRITIEVEADGFLYNMVRAIVGTLVEVGRGAQSPDWVRQVLEACDRSQAGPTAPPQGLFLLWVKYPDAIYANR